MPGIAADLKHHPAPLHSVPYGQQILISQLWMTTCQSSKAGVRIYHCQSGSIRLQRTGMNKKATPSSDTGAAFTMKDGV